MADNAQGIKAGQAYVALHLDDQMKPALEASKANLDGWAKAVDAAGAQATKGVTGRILTMVREQQRDGQLQAIRLIDQGGEGLLRVAGYGVAGAIATVIGRGLKDVTAQAVKLREEFDEDKIGALGIAGGLIESIPIVGDIESAFENVVELFVGGTAIVKDMNAELKDGVDYIKAQQDASRELGSILTENAAKSGKAATEVANIGAAPEVQAINNIKESESERLATRPQRELDSIRKVVEGRQKVLDVAMKSLEDLSKEYAAAGRPALTLEKGDPFTSRFEEANRQIKEAQAAFTASTASARASFRKAEGYGADTGEIGAAAAAKIADENHKYSLRVAKSYEQSGQEMKGAQNQAAAAELENIGRVTDAKIRMIESSRDKQLSANQEAMDELTKSFGGKLDPGIIGNFKVLQQAIRDKAQADIDAANLAKRSPGEERMGQNMENLEQYAEANRKANQKEDDENKKVESEKTKRGLARTIEIDEAQRAIELREAQDSGLGDPAKINRKYDLMEQIARMQNQPPTWGSFSAAAIAASSRAGPTQNKTEELLQMVNGHLVAIKTAIEHSGALGT